MSFIRINTQSFFIGISLLIIIPGNRGMAAYKAQFHLNTGIFTNNASNLNSLMDDYGYSQLKKDNVALGLGFNIIKNRWIFGFDGDFYTERGITSGGNIHYFSGAVSIKAGITILKNEEWFAFSQLGLGLKNLTISLSRLNHDLEFDDILIDPGKSEILKCENGIARAVITLQRFLWFPSEKNSLFVGISTGIDLALGKTNWRIGSFTDAEGPNVDLGGFFAKISAGGSFEVK